MNNEIKITNEKNYADAIWECSRFLIKKYHETNEYKEKLVTLYKIRQILALNYIQGTMDYYETSNTYEQLKRCLVRMKEYDPNDEILVGSAI